MPRVAVVGHVEWVDFIEVERVPREGEVLHARASFARAAGGGGVVAVVLAELGAEVHFFTALGDDPHGRAAADQLGERGVNVHVAWRSQEPTRRAVTLLEGGGERTIVTVGQRLDPRGSDELGWELLRETDGVYFTAGDAVALERARAARVLIASPRGRSVLRAAGGRTIDAIVYSRGDSDEREWTRRLASRARLTVETRGAEGGAWWGDSRGSWRAAALDGRPRDAYGCGDSFAAGFTFGLASGEAIADAAALGARWGARCLTRAGAP
jgi:ribokinase